MAWTHIHDLSRINVNDTALLSFRKTESDITMVFDSFKICSHEGFRVNRERCKLSYRKTNTWSDDTIHSDMDVIAFSVEDHHHRYVLDILKAKGWNVRSLDIQFSDCSFLAESNNFGEPFNYFIKRFQMDNARVVNKLMQHQIHRLAQVRQSSFEIFSSCALVTVRVLVQLW